ncbi:Predicted P-loop ATPase [Yersinia mollaretii]|uniref:KAP family P-loop NTPase fold protein n=1 Tax=Yersinia mollaretii TaxID=33060 RepID=UPI0005DCE2DE|nr:P-loop NTPase fold protein [Yersinia mollaretii]CNJ78152.1 Predicted P-loop ATPase [Yersinia mollaretii]
MSFDWSEVSCGGYPADRLDRAKYAEFLTKFLIEKGKNENYVLNLNAQWGAGKTWFLRRWAEEIEDKYPVVFIDAWKSDHSKDPFLAVITEIQHGLKNKTDKSLLESPFIENAWRMIKSIAPEVTKAVIKTKFGVDIDKATDLISGDGAADIGAKLVEAAMSAHEEANKSIEYFKKAINAWLESVVGTNKDYDYPLFIFIDELDRCRPTYAIEMLETIKHLFDMKRVVFIIATDKEQLEHSIKAVYGVGFDSQRYLNRFFNRTLTLRKPNHYEYIFEIISSSIILQNYLGHKSNSWFIVEIEDASYIEQYAKILSAISQMLYMDLRTINQWMERIEASVTNVSVKFDIIFLSFILSINCVSNESYQNLFAGKLPSSIERTSFFTSMTGGRKLNSENINFKINGQNLGTSFRIDQYNTVRNDLRAELIKLSITDLFYLLFSIVIIEDKINGLTEEIANFSNAPSQSNVIERHGKAILKAIILNDFKNTSLKLSDYADIVELACILE